MEVPTTITDDEYLVLRREARQTLINLGIASNPGFTDHNIISGLRIKKDLPPVEPWDEWADDTPNRFRDSLAECLAIEQPFTIGEIALGLRNL